MKRIILVLLLIFFLLCPLAEGKWSNEKEYVAIPDETTMIGDTIYFSIDRMDFDRYRSIFLGYSKFNWNKAIIDLSTYGGSVFDAMGMVSLIQEQQRRGKIIEIRGRGLIASAGLIVLIAGTPGYRFLDANAMLMFHELWSFKFFAIETPSDKEAEAEIFRKIQNKINFFIVNHSKITDEELNLKIKKKEFWFDSTEAIKYGFADGVF